MATERKVWHLIRVYHGVHHSFSKRWLEWLMSAFIISWGLHLLDERDSFEHIAAWHGLSWWAPDYVWGTVCVMVGAIRVIALTVNGTFRDTIYSKFSPLVRGMSAGICGGIWLMVELSAISAVPPTQGGVTYLFVSFIDLFTAYYVLGEAGDNLRAHGYGRRRLD